MPTPLLAIFTDLDGTFIDFETYSHELTAPLARDLGALGIPVIFCSSKTFSEQTALQKAMGLRMPCILENGAGIAVPEDYWPNMPEGFTVEEGWGRLALGKSAYAIGRGVQAIESAIGEALKSFRSMQTEDVARLTGLDLCSAKRAQQRDYSVTLSVQRPDSFWEEIDPLFEQHGLRCLPGGRFHTVIDAQTNKGVALKRFVELWQLAAAKPFELKTIALGDSPNDFDMLAAADIPYQVQRPDASWAEIAVDGIRKVDAIGPAGWVLAVNKTLNEFGLGVGQAEAG